jgi:ribosomal protein L7Ae-like RNA K-turn-binding protein
MDIPYCFVKGRAVLGNLVHQKNAAVLALTDVRKEVIKIYYSRIKMKSTI